MANIITAFRILFSIALLFVSPFSKLFYALYITAGLSDMLDGPVARKTGTTSDFGSKLDSISDIIFVTACLIKLLPIISIEKWLYIWIALIALIKIINIVSGLIMYKRIIFLYTILNKITGLLAFILPLTLPILALSYTAPVICTVATIAAIQEGHYIRTGNILK
jgi:CDP-diacylglycerol--glycerol-3-phosphate 3-phosphatidyltransferase